MSYGFTRLVCINPPTRKEILEWNPDLDEVAISILLQLLENEYIQDQVVPDYDSYNEDPSEVYTVCGIDSLTRAVSGVLLCSDVVELGFCGRDKVWAVIQRWHTQKPAIVFYHYREAHNIELTTEAELIKTVKGI
jgi:hypothetical protein